MADVFCRQSRLRIEAPFDRLFRNADDSTYRLAQEVLRGEHAWLERGAVQAIPDGVRVAPDSGAAGAAGRREKKVSGERVATQVGAGG